MEVARDNETHRDKTGEHVTLTLTFKKAISASAGGSRKDKTKVSGFIQSINELEVILSRLSPYPNECRKADPVPLLVPEETSLQIGPIFWGYFLECVGSGTIYSVEWTYLQP